MISIVHTPRINTNDNVVEVVQWHVGPEAFVEVGEDIVDLQTSKAVVTIVAECRGYVAILVETRALVRVGKPLFVTADSIDELRNAPIVVEAKGTLRGGLPVVSHVQYTRTLTSGRFSSTRFSKAALAHLREANLSESDFAGAGLVTERLLRGEQTPSRGEGTTTHPREVVSRDAVPIPAESANLRREPTSLAKFAEIEALSTGEAGNINSALTVYFRSAAIRDRLRRETSFDGNIHPVLYFELARLLTQWPSLTAFYHGDAVHYYDRVDLGVAIDLGKGLKVVTFPAADRLMPIEFFDDIVELGIRYMENKVRPEELVGSTFTVTDLSGMDVLHFHPLINGRQSAILAVGGDSALPGHPMSLTISFDHRVATGRDVALFLRELRSRILSYAPADVPRTPPYVPSVAKLAARDENELVECDKCGIELGEYYATFPSDAFMFAVYRSDGSIGCACHRCAGGFI